MRSGSAGVLCGLLLCAATGCYDIERLYRGVSGASFQAGDQFVILKNGYRSGRVTWVAVQSWPIASTPEERRADSRVVLGDDAEYRIRYPDGSLRTPSEDTAYVFYGAKLVIFGIRMNEDDFGGFFTMKHHSYEDVERFLRKYAHSAQAEE